MGQVQIDVEANTYQMSKLTPVAVPFWEGLVELMEQHGVECEKAKEILINSGSKKYVRRT